MSRRRGTSPENALPAGAAGDVAAADLAATGQIERYALLAEATGRSWFEDEATALRATGRALCGGWPGTLREARQRVEAAIGTTLSARATAELGRRTYTAARSAWQARAVREPAEP